MLTSREIVHLAIAFFTLAIVIGFYSIVQGDLIYTGKALLFAFLILGAAVAAKKIAANALDADIEHEIWMWWRYGMKPGWHLDRAVPAGVMLPLFLTAFSLGAIKCMAFLTYETSALKRRAAKRFGYYSFTEMTDWHNAVIGAAGIIAVLLLATIAYFIPGLEGLPSLAVFYAFWNLIPFSKLDGAQIFFGSRPLYTAIGLVTLVFLAGVFIIS